MPNRELAFYINPCGPDRREIMELLSEAGVSRIGMDGVPWRVGPEDDEIEQFLEDCGRCELSVCSMHSTLPVLARPDQPMPAELREAHEREMARFARLGGETAVYHACAMRDVSLDEIDAAVQRVGWPEFVSCYVEALVDLARVAGAFGITVVLENIWHSQYCSSVTPILELVRTANRPNVGIILDSGHAHLAGFSVGDEIRRAGHWLRDTHFHDNVGDLSLAKADQHLPPGLGTIDWQDACLALQEIEFDGAVVFEGVLGPGDSIPAGRFGGYLSHHDLISITIANWRAFEYLALQRKLTRPRAG